LAGKQPASGETGERYVTRTALREQFGMSEPWIRRLGEPDRTEAKPGRRRGGPVRQLWREGRVRAFLDANRDDFVRHRAGRKGQAGTKGGSKGLRDAALDWVERAEIILAPLPADLNKACRLYLNRTGRRDHTVSPRAIVAMLRHGYTNYDALLDALAGDPGRWRAYPLLRARVNASVCAATGIACTPEATGDDEDAVWLRGRWGSAG
jgi:hypothetical protein